MFHIVADFVLEWYAEKDMIGRQGYRFRDLKHNELTAALFIRNSSNYITELCGKS